MDGRNGKGNGQGIAIELCVNSDGNYNETVKTGIELTKHLMQKHGISDVRVITHHDASGKWCPREILNNKNGLDWNDFKSAIKGTSTVKVDTKPVTPSTNNEPYQGSIVDYLNQQGIKSNMNNRKNLAVEYGIVNDEHQYTGTADQNTRLLRAMITSEPKQEGTRKEEITSGYKGNSIVDYLVSIKKDASFSSRANLAKQNGINNYTGTAKQNADLLAKLRSSQTTSTPKPVSAPAKKTNNVTNYKGDSIVDYLNLSGNKHLGGSGFNNRKALASANGISGYTGTASQNKQLLSKLMSGGSAPASKPTPAKAKSKRGSGIRHNTGSIVDYLNFDGNKHLGGSSFANRQKLAKEAGISNYRGSADQNKRLLKWLKP